MVLCVNNMDSEPIGPERGLELYLTEAVAPATNLVFVGRLPLDHSIDFDVLQSMLEGDPSTSAEFEDDVRKWKMART